MGSLRRFFSRHSDQLVGGLDADFIALQDEEDGITYILKLSREDMRHALDLSRQAGGNARLPSIGGRLMMAGDFACVSFHGPSGSGALIVDPAQLRSRLATALHLRHPDSVPTALVVPFPVHA